MRPLFKLSLVTLGVLTASTALAGSPSNDQLQREIQLINARDQQLQQQVQVLRAKLAKQHSGLSVQRAPVSHALLTTNRGRHVSLGLEHLSGHGPTVTTTPFMGASTAYDASDVLDQVSKWNEQLTLLKLRSDLAKTAGAHGLSIKHPILELSGGIEGQLYNVYGYGKDTAPTGVNLSKAEIDINAIMSSWINGFMALQYGNSSESTSNRISQNGISLDRAFFTLGNLNKTPFYLSMGRMYVPFGRYSSILLSSPVTQTLGQVVSDTALVGFSSHNFYGSAFGYSGYRTSDGHAQLFKQGGADLGYTYHFANPVNHVTGGVSVISNLADAKGLQNVPGVFGSRSSGFSSASGNGNSNLSHDVPAIDGHLSVGYNQWGGNVEFVSALRAFNAADFGFGSSASAIFGARPKALHGEVTYTMHCHNKPITVAAGFDHTWQALAASLPEYSFEGVVQTSWWHNTIETIEYRRDRDYRREDFGKLAAGNAFAGANNYRNSIIAQLGVYF